MHNILDAFERREISALEVEAAVGSHMAALEALPYHKIHDARHLNWRLVNADLTDGDASIVETFDVEKVSAVLQDFRAFLKTLPWF